MLKGRYTDLAAFVAAAMSPEGKKIGKSIYMDFDPLSDGAAGRIQEAAGLDVHGFGHALDGSAVVHILNRHGENGTALKDFPNQVPVTVEDLGRIPDIVENADVVELADKPQRIRFKKRINGYFLLIEETRSKFKKLVPVTFWKTKAAASPRTSET